jgi:transcriptional regulator with XRE-family HTH domain
VTALEQLNALDDSEVIDMITSGRTQAEIARELGVNVATLNKWLHSDPKRSARAKTAMAASAEALLDRAHDGLLEAPSDASEIARWRALEQHYARRAAIRNPMYRERTGVEVSGDQHNPVTMIVRTVVDPVRKLRVPDDT